MKRSQFATLISQIWAVSALVVTPTSAKIACAALGLMWAIESYSAWKKGE